MILPPIYELALVGVADAGVPNAERILIRTSQPVNLAQFGVLLGLPFGMESFAQPMADQFFWFGDTFVTAPGWVILYTGPGLHQVTYVAETNEPAWVYHWGKPKTLFGSSATRPMLVRLGGISIAPAPQMLGSGQTP